MLNGVAGMLLVSMMLVQLGGGLSAQAAFGLGLAFYATPSTDAALSNLPDDQAGSGSGLYKMASSLGASFGVAISAAIFTALSADTESARWLEG
jgi:MFS transporter, DHA2 family, multidrug resistance protein